MLQMLQVLAVFTGRRAISERAVCLIKRSGRAHGLPAGDRQERLAYLFA